MQRRSRSLRLRSSRSPSIPLLRRCLPVDVAFPLALALAGGHALHAVPNLCIRVLLVSSSRFLASVHLTDTATSPHDTETHQRQHEYGHKRRPPLPGMCTVKRTRLSARSPASGLNPSTPCGSALCRPPPCTKPHRAPRRLKPDSPREPDFLMRAYPHQHRKHPRVCRSGWDTVGVTSAACILHLARQTSAAVRPVSRVFCAVQNICPACIRLNRHGCLNVRVHCADVARRRSTPAPGTVGERMSASRVCIHIPHTGLEYSLVQDAFSVGHLAL
ncbi:hypothetical protein LXA43DRAFT_1016272, partial [Ganoderma leucocontextum]